MKRALYITSPAFVLLCALFLSAADVNAPPYSPTSNYDDRRMQGWTVRINRDLLTQYPQLTDDVLRLLDAQLYQITRVVPAKALQALRDHVIWVEYKGEKFKCMCYHISRDWLTENGFNPEKEGGVEISNARNFLTWTLQQPWMVLHELSHGYYHKVLGDNDPAVRQAWRNAEKSGAYDSVLHIDGKKYKAYAMNNEKEYFAECVEAYFGTNDFYPFVRSELKEHDQEMFQIMRKIWGE